MTMKTILVPTDFSEPSYYGLDAAAELAKKIRASIHIFNACEVSNYYYAADPLVMAPPAAIMIEGINESLLKAANKKLAALKSRASLKGLKVTTHCEVTSNIHDAIIAYGDKIKCDIIIMGSHGAGNIREVILGSNAERVVRFSLKPVIVFPLKPVKGLFKKIVFASDFSPEAYSVFPLVKEVAKINSSEIHLLKINTMDQFSKTKDDRELLSAFSKKFGGKFTTAVYNDYMKEEGILNYSREVKADLIAIGTHGKRGLRRFFSEDVSEGIVRLSHIPILIVNLKKAAGKKK